MKRDRKNKLPDIFKRIAEQNNTTIAEVERELEVAIQAGVSNPDPKIQAIWAKIPKAGDIPTSEELIAYCAKQLKKGKSNSNE